MGWNICAGAWLRHRGHNPGHHRPADQCGVLLCKHPEVKGKIKEIVMMGGAYYMHYNEWNILCDPEAAHIVYSSGVPIRAIGLDVTTRCQVNDQLVTLFRNSKTGSGAAGRPAHMLLREPGTPHLPARPHGCFAVYDKDIITYQGKTSMWSFTDSIPEAPPLIHGR